MTRARAMQRGLVGMLGAVVVFGLLGPGCEPDGGEGSETKSSQQEGEPFVAGSEAEMFTFAMESDPASIDPVRVSGVPGGRVVFNIFEGLLMPAQTTEGAEGPADLVRPGVAEEYEVSDDGLVYTFHLRDDAKWSNGRSVTASDFVYAWKRTLLPGYTPDYAQLFYVIEGVENYNDEDTESNWEDVGIEATDAHTIEIRLEHPTPYFPELVAFYPFFPQPKAAVKDHRGDWTKADNIVTNGPYTLEEYEKGAFLVLEKNPHYWAADDVAIERAKIRIVEEAGEVARLYDEEKLHWTGRSLTPAQVPEYEDRPGFRREESLGTHYVRVNVSDEESFRSKPPFARALRLAVDKRGLLEEQLNGMFRVADTFVPDGVPGYDSEYTPERDVEEARALIEELGVPDGEDLGEIELLYNAGWSNERVAEGLKRQWKQTLGLEVTLREEPWENYLESIDITDYELARSGWIGDYNDALSFLEMWTTDNGNNDTGWSNERYDELVERAEAAEGSPARAKHLMEAERLLMEKGPIIPLYHFAEHVMVGSNVRGWKPHNRNIHLLRDMRIEK